LSDPSERLIRGRRPAALAATVVVAAIVIAVAFVVAGCGAAPAASLPGTSWVVTSIDGTATGPGATPTIEFGPGGTVIGTTGCNRYSGEVTIDGDRIGVGNLSSTLIGCEGALAAQEHGFVAALAGATTWSIDPTGHLLLKGAGDIVATPLEPRAT
jgi:heat shock protein HslJ